MPKPTNPFSYGGAPVETAKFIGRRNEIDRVFDLLNNPARGSVALSGERRIGKTSLLHYISAPDVLKERWAGGPTLFIFQDCQAIAPFTMTNFWKSILRLLQRQLKERQVGADLLEAVQEIRVQREIAAVDIQFLLRDLHEAGWGWVLILDEFEWCIRRPLRARPRQKIVDKRCVTRTGRNRVRFG